MWRPPSLTVHWPEYFRPEPTDDAQLVTMTVAAHEAGLITRRAAVQRLARTFDIENVDQFLDVLDEEREEHGNAELAMQQAIDAMNNPDDEEPGGQGNGGDDRAAGAAGQKAPARTPSTGGGRVPGRAGRKPG